MQDVVFHPASASPRWKGPALLALPLLFVVIWIGADDMASRLIFLAFASAFVVLAMLGARYYRTHFSHPLRLGAAGMAWLPFVERYGVTDIPWREIERVDLFRNAYSDGPGARCLRLFIRDGDFRQKLRRPPGERVFGGDVNVLLGFDADPEVVVETVRRFHRQFGG
ncbi:MAG: hypothetical protein KF771_01505 [Burkholderiales bacterium]|nr:hypothetical protein [Burkholderiales bacterium]